MRCSFWYTAVFSGMIRVAIAPATTAGATRRRAGWTPPGQEDTTAIVWETRLLRALRHWTTARATDAAMFAAPRISTRALCDVGRLLASAGRHAPVVAGIVAANMRALRVYSPSVHRAHFDRLGEHFAGALHALRCVEGHGRAERRREFAELATRRVDIDPSVSRLQAALERRPGAIVTGPHITNYLVNLARLNQVVPLTVYLRHSKDARRRNAKQRWYEASGVDWISEPAQAGGLLGRLKHMASALAEGRVLFITPDLPQKRDSGTPVRFFNREIYLPAGATVLAARTGAPLFMLTATTDGPRQRLNLEGPYALEIGEPARGSRRAAAQRAIQWFATRFEEFIRREAPLWYLWGDKRWTRVLRGDPRYVRTPARPTPAAGAARGVANATGTG